MSNMSKAIAVLGVVAALGATMVPLTSYAADPTEIKGAGNPLSATKDVPVQLTITETLSMYVTNSDGTEDVSNPVVLSTNVDSTANYQSDPVAVKVIANNTNGFYLTMHGSASTNATSLTSGANTIAAGNLSGSTSTWGFKVTEGSGSSTFGSWTAVKAQESADVINTTSAPTGADGSTAKVVFGAHVVDTQPAGTYAGQVTFTATAGAKA